ncbi:MAG: phosphatidylserine/phosphatidylglycerophosphate/cardiolipin synthase family protein [Syntrophotaleaceae bacterium]
MRKYRYPQRRGDTYRLLVGGGEFFPEMEKSIAEAECQVLLEMYLFESGGVADRFIRLLVDAVQRNVRVCLMLDAYGALALRKSDRQQLVAGGVELTFYNPLGLKRWSHNLLRNHRKLLLVDDRVAFTGGAGITDSFDPSLNPSHWQDTMLAISGPSLRDWRHLFTQTWNRWAERSLDPGPVKPAQPQNPETLGRVTAGRRVGSSEIMRSYIRLVRRAKQRIWLATPYFVPPWKLRRALRRQARQGRDVRLLLPGPYTDHPAVRIMGGRFYHRMLVNGVRIFEYQPRFLHTKMLLCDAWVSTGSCNADGWNYRWNLEANQEARDEDLALQVERMFHEEFAQSREILGQEWGRRGWTRRLREWFWGRVAAWLVRFSDRDGSGRGPDGP